MEVPYEALYAAVALIIGFVLGLFIGLLSRRSREDIQYRLVEGDQPGGLTDQEVKYILDLQNRVAALEKAGKGNSPKARSHRELINQQLRKLGLQVEGEENALH